MFKRIVLPATNLLLAFILGGCAALFPTAAPTNLPPEMLGTAIVMTNAAIDAAAGTATSTARPTRTPLPSETPRPTWTPSQVPSPTVTFVITIPAIGVRPGSNATPTKAGITYPYRPLQDYEAANGCDLVALSPANGTIFAPGDSFDAEWTFANYGPLVWDNTDVDYKYVSGSKMQKFGDLFDLPVTVFPGERIKIIVDMVAPAKAGSYSASWMLTHGDRLLCQVSVNIVVK